MALQKTFLTSIGVNGDYIKAEKFESIDYRNATGLIIIQGYISAAAYAAGAQVAETYTIPLGADTKFDASNGVFTRIKFSDIVDKSEVQRDALLMTGKIKFNGLVVDLTTATPV